MLDVVALGELLIDLTQNGLSAQGNPTLEANPGGAPCNVLAMLERLGKKTAFIGKVGKDIFSNQLCKETDENNSNTIACDNTTIQAIIGVIFIRLLPTVIMIFLEYVKMPTLTATAPKKNSTCSGVNAANPLTFSGLNGHDSTNIPTALAILLAPNA